MEDKYFGGENFWWDLVGPSGACLLGGATSSASSLPTGRRRAPRHGPSDRAEEGCTSVEAAAPGRKENDLKGKTFGG